MLQRKFLRRQLLITLCLNSSAIIGGYTVGWTSPVVPLLQDINQTPLAHVLSVSQASWTLTAVLIGVIIGTCLCGWISNKMGRKRTMIAGGFVNILGYIILTWANNFVMLIVGRTLSGFGMGLVVPSNLVYLGEVASANIRGVLMTSLGVSHSIGSLIVYCIGPFTSYQVIGYVALLICLTHLVGCFFLPESPLFYIIKDQEDSAREVLQYVGRNEGNGQELTNIVKHVRQSKQMTWRDLMKDKSNRRGFMVILPLFLNQEWSGIATITFFAITIFKEAGSSVEPALASIIIGATNLVGTLLVPGVIDRFGRRILLIFSTCGCAISMYILGFYFFLDRYEYSIIDSIRWFPVILLVLTSIFFTLGLNIVPNTLVGELFRPNVRSVCSSIVLSTGFTSCLIASIAFGYIFEYLGIHVIFWIFAGVNTLGFLFTFFIVPETKGLTLLEIEKMLGSELIT